MGTKPTLTDRTRAAVALVNTKQASEDLELHAFMALFHPDVPQDTVRELVRDRKKP